MTCRITPIPQPPTPVEELAAFLPRLWSAKKKPRRRGDGLPRRGDDSCRYRNIFRVYTWVGSLSPRKLTGTRHLAGWVRSLLLTCYIHSIPPGPLSFTIREILYETPVTDTKSPASFSCELEEVLRILSRGFAFNHFLSRVCLTVISAKEGWLALFSASFFVCLQSRKQLCIF